MLDIIEIRSLQQTRRYWLRDLLTLTLVVAILFGMMLGNRSLNVPDEARYSEIPREMVVRGDYLTPHLNDIKYFEKPPLFYWLQAGSIKTFGLNEWALRLPTALLALLGCLATYSGARALYGRRCGWLASIILSTSLLYFSMAHLITLDMAVTVALTSALLSFLVGVRYPPGMTRRILLWSFYACAALAMLMKGLISIILPGMIIGSWLLLCRDFRLLKSIYLPSGILLFLAIAAPWHILVQQVNPEFFHFYFIEQQFERYLTMSAGRYQPIWFFIPMVLAGFFPWTVFLFQAVTWQSFKQHREALFLLLWAGLIFVFFSLSNSKLIPYILPIFPPLAILTARYLDQAFDHPGIKKGFIALPFCGLALGIAVIVLPYFHTVENPTITRYFSFAFAALLVGGNFAAYIGFMRGRLRTGLAIIIANTVLTLWLVVAAAPYVETRSIKPLALTLKPLLKVGDEVAAFGIYYQDLPFYLQQRVTIVDWKNELTFGMRHQDASAWMIDTPTFWRRWVSEKRVYMVIPREKYHQLRKISPHSFYPVAQTVDNILLCNQPLNMGRL